VTVQQAAVPIVTYALLITIVAVFIAEHLYPVGPWSGPLAPNILTLLAWGGLNRDLVFQSGEWYRLFSAALLHSDLFHLIFNGVALYFAGAMLEPLVGRAWFFALFALGALSGSLMSLAVNPPTMVSVGASGAIMGLLTAAFVCSFRFLSGGARTRIQMILLQVFIPSLIPIAISRTGHDIDFAAHIGGALNGALLGLALLKIWPAADPLPRFSGLAATVSAVGVLAFALAFVPVKQQRETYALELLLIPNDQLPQSSADRRSRSEELVARYPRDPRSRMFRASALFDARDLVGAERELRAGLAEERILRTKFSPDFEVRLRTMLALVLFERGQLTEAKKEAKPVCASSAFNAVRDTLNSYHLCE
jgi:rhomboid protease GluP